MIDLVFPFSVQCNIVSLLALARRIKPVKIDKIFGYMFSQPFGRSISRYVGVKKPFARTLSSSIHKTTFLFRVVLRDGRYNRDS